MAAWANSNCEICGAPLEQRTMGRPRRTCSDLCRKRLARHKSQQNGLHESRPAKRPNTQPTGATLSLPGAMPARRKAGGS